MKKSDYVFLSLLFNNVVHITGTGISRDCLKCICQVEGCDSEIGKCSNYGTTCGPYQITYNYWIDCGRLGEDYETCTKTKQCSEFCVRNYMQKYGTLCTDGHNLTCKDHAKIHHGGPNGCKDEDDSYWHKVELCLNPPQLQTSTK